jgi:hypothetical protein
MCEASDNNGIQSQGCDGLDHRNIGAGGSETWTLIRKRRDIAWEAIGLDPAVLRCPPFAKDIHLSVSGEQNVSQASGIPAARRQSDPADDLEEWPLPSMDFPDDLLLDAPTADWATFNF